jgi:hypothetical protein
MLRYASGAILTGTNLREALEIASAILVAEGYPPIPVVDGDRSYEAQVAVFLERYALAANIGGRRVYDWRTWNGALYGRISPEGTVAPPSRTAPHVAKIAADLGAPYNNRFTAAHARLQQIGPGLGLVWTGRNFGEDWHWETNRGVGQITAAASVSAALPTPEPEEEEMKLLMHVKLDDGTDPWFVVRYETGTAARMFNGLQLDISRAYGKVVEVAGIQTHDAIRGLTRING